MIDFVYNDKSIDSALVRMCEYYGFDAQTYVDIISQYKQKFGIEDKDFDTSNFGLLVGLDNQIQPAVWSKMHR